MKPIPLPATAADTVAYVRVSTEDQATDLRSSLADQRAAIAQLSEQLGRQVACVFEDPGASGASAEGRPGFMALLEYCRARRRSARSPGYVLVLNDSRWGRFRDPEEAGYWRVELRRHGWLVRFAENDSGDSPARPLERAMFQWTSTAYRDAIVANAKRGVRGTAAQGFWANEAPLGYRRQVVAGGPTRTLAPGQRKAPNEKVRLVPGPAAEVALVQSLFARYGAGTISVSGLVRELQSYTGSDIPARKWAVQSLAKLLRSETYLGHVIWCRRPHDALERETTPVRPAEQWVVTRDAHPALITQELFDQVQARLALNGKHLRRTDGGYALTSLLTCVCGRLYVGGGGKKGPPEDPNRYRFYRCAGQKETTWTCTAISGTLSRRFIEPAIIAAIGAIVSAPALERLIAASIERKLAALTTSHAETRAALERRRDELEASHRRLVDAIAAGTLAAVDAAPSLVRIRRETEDAAAALERTRFASRQAKTLQTERDRVLALVRDFPALAAKLDGLALRELLRPWVESAVVDLGARAVRVAIRQIPAASGMFAILSSGGADATTDKLIVRCSIPLPPIRRQGGRHEAVGG
jgi:DNA invertase Pin-like site-specific DNA recombinase